MPQPLKTFIIYAREDAAFKNELLRQLAPFAQMGLLEKWDDSNILPGEEWEKSIEKALEASQIVLMLVSADSLFSNFIQRRELKKALEQKREGSTRVIPILVRDCLYDMAEGISDLQMLPLHPVSRLLVPVDDLSIWGSRSSAWAAALRQLREVIADVHALVEAEEKARLKEEEKLTALAAEQEVKVQHEKEVKARAERHGIKDKAAWKSTIELDNLDAYESYLDDGYTVYQAEAHQRIHDLTAADTKRKAEQKTKEKAAAAKKAKEEEEKHQREEIEKKRLADLDDLAALAAEARRAKEAEAKQAEENRKKHEQAERERKAKEADPFHNLMIPIKGGTFDMGDTFGDGDASEKPIHKVTVPNFHLCKYPVTQAQWKKIMGDNPAYFQGDDLPVEKVSWDDAQAFLKKLNAQTGQEYRLPSEAAWEYAAREGGKKVRFGNGKDIADPKEMNFYGTKEYKQPYSIVGEYRQKTTPVSQFKPNALGLHDMSGNVWEWCQDVWHEDYKGAPNDGTAWEQGGDSTRRVVRGGSWDIVPFICRAAYRLRDISGNRNYDSGFRLAR